LGEKSWGDRGNSRGRVYTKEGEHKKQRFQIWEGTRKRMARITIRPSFGFAGQKKKQKTQPTKEIGKKKRTKFRKKKKG